MSRLDENFLAIALYDHVNHTYINTYIKTYPFHKVKFTPFPAKVVLAYLSATKMCRITKTTHLCGHCTREIELCFYGRRRGPSWCPYGNCVRRAVPRGCNECQTLQVQQ